MKLQILILLFLFQVNRYFSQNLISNGSFSEWNNNDSTKNKKIRFKYNTDIKDWYYPEIFNNLNFGDKKSLYSCSRYYSVKELQLYKKNFFQNDEQFPEIVVDKNDGLICSASYYGGLNHTHLVLQQKLKTPIKDSGYYLLKFKLKIEQHYYQKGGDFPPISFCFSKNNLSYYFTGRRLNLPTNKIQFMFITGYNNLQFDLDWQTVCTKVYLSKGIKYFTFGDLCKVNLKNQKFGGLHFLIDDIELYKTNNDENLCVNNFGIADLNFKVKKIIFPLNTTLFSDSLIAYGRNDVRTDTLITYGAHNCFTKGTIYKLKQLVLFLMENHNLKITINAYCLSKHTNKLYNHNNDLLTSKVLTYLAYHGISEERINCKINHLDIEKVTVEEKRIVNEYERYGKFSILITENGK
ncbi:MAG: hypothetical protein IM592_01375 [Bacteroidetes bacterium]|nr:hypothetical protein [Bacteroidota bacterium]